MLISVLLDDGTSFQVLTVSGDSGMKMITKRSVCEQSYSATDQNSVGTSNYENGKSVHVSKPLICNSPKIFQLYTES